MGAAPHHSAETKSLTDKLIREGLGTPQILQRVRGINAAFVKRRKLALKKEAEAKSQKSSGS